MTTNITIAQDQITEFCQRHNIQKLSLFGSVLRDDFSPISDIDVLVEFEPNTRPTLFDMGEMQMELSEILGREVDFKTPGYLSKHFRQDVQDSAQVLYVRGR